MSELRWYITVHAVIICLCYLTSLFLCAGVFVLQNNAVKRMLQQDCKICLQVCTITIFILSLERQYSQDSTSQVKAGMSEFLSS